MRIFVSICCIVLCLCAALTSCSGGKNSGCCKSQDTPDCCERVESELPDCCTGN